MSLQFNTMSAMSLSMSYLTNISYIGFLKHIVFVCVCVFVFVFGSTTSMSDMSMSYLKSLNPLLLKNIKYIGSLNHIVFDFLCVFVFACEYGQTDKPTNKQNFHL